MVKAIVKWLKDYDLRPDYPKVETIKELTELVTKIKANELRDYLKIEMPEGEKNKPLYTILLENEKGYKIGKLSKEMRDLFKAVFRALITFSIDVAIKNNFHSNREKLNAFYALFSKFIDQSNITSLYYQRGLEKHSIRIYFLSGENNPRRTGRRPANKFGKPSGKWTLWHLTHRRPQ
jgi:hypothetical protein